MAKPGWVWGTIVALCLGCSAAAPGLSSASTTAAKVQVQPPPQSPGRSTTSLAQSVPASVQTIDQYVQAVAGFGPNRSAGSAGAQRTGAFYAQKLTAGTSRPVWRQPFSMVVPRSQFCRAVDPQNPTMPIPLSLMRPCGGQLAALPGQQRHTAPVVYVGRGRLPQLRGLQIAHAWVAMNISGSRHWLTIAGLGARGIIFLGSPKSDFHDFGATATTVPVTIPRFYTQDSAVVAAIRTGKIRRLKIQWQAQWVRRIGENLLCLIPPSVPTADSHATPPKSLIILTARYDASSYVLGHSPGAQQDVGSAILAALAPEIARAQLGHPVLIALLADNAWQFTGEVQLLRMLTTSPATLTSRLVRRRLAWHKANHIWHQLQRLHATKDVRAIKLESPLAHTIGNQIQADVSKLQSALDVQLLLPPADRRHSLIKLLEKRKLDLLVAHNAVHTHHHLVASQTVILRAVEQLLPQWQMEARRSRQRVHRVRAWRSIRRHLGLASLKILVQLNLHLTSHGREFGFITHSSWMSNDFSDEMSQFDSAMTRNYFGQARRHAHKMGLPFHCAFNPLPAEAVNSVHNYFPIPLGFCTDYALWRGLPGATFATLCDDSGLIDTPNDTTSRIDWRSMARQVAALKLLLLGSRRFHSLGALTDPEFAGRVTPQDQTSNQTFTVLRRSFGQAVASLGAPNYLAGAVYTSGSGPLPPVLEGTRRSSWKFTHFNGSVHFNKMPYGWFQYALQVFKFASDGMPKKVLAGNLAVQGYSNGLFSPDSSTTLQCLVFTARPINLYGLFDPRYLDYIDQLQILDARKGGAPKYDQSFTAGMAGIAYVQPGVPWQVLVSRGSLANRMILINASLAHPLGTGFLHDGAAYLGPLSWRTATDLNLIDAQRRSVLQKFGITSNVINTFFNAAKKHLQAGQKARDSRQYNRWLGQAAASWSLQIQAYHALISDSNGIVDGAIFLLLGLIPFSYFLERLLIGSPNVYRQIGGFSLIFAVMTAVLASFHPAFRITKAPLMILLAFVILLLSAVVIHILFQKFENELGNMRGARASSHKDTLRGSAVFGAALRLGLSNMRRRGTRTTLTLITLVLLTFTLLCFTSLRHNLTLVPNAEPNAPTHPATGILLRQRAWLPMPQVTLQLAREIVGRHGLVAPVYWYASTNTQRTWHIAIHPARFSQLRTTNPTVAGLVGISPRADEFFKAPAADIAAQLPGWKKLLAGQAVCFLPAELHGHPFHRNQKVRILGRTFTIAGFFNTRNFTVRQITGEPIFPVDASASAQSSQTPANTNPSQLAAMREPNLTFLRPAEVAILPAGMVRSFGGHLTSAMLWPQGATPKTIFRAARHLARRCAFSVIASNGRQVISYNASANASVSNLSAVLVPLAIAAVIVLNTMLGAVSERTREIHVYTSLGLAPSHVGMLFLAEAAALGTLGVVFGYICGQAVATLLTYTHLISGVHLNYSSLSAIGTMGLVLALVMASTIWPARMASRVAAPSLQRHWKLPEPVGDILQVDLPFTVNALAAHGICKFIEEFFSDVSQSGVGRFTAEKIAAFSHQGIHGITAQVWLAPYDLGVIQEFWMAIHPTPEPNVFEVKLTLLRQAGSPATWVRLNRPFMVEVRNQFLLWRSVAPEMVRQYVTGSQQMFAQAAGTLPPVAA